MVREKGERGEGEREGKRRLVSLRGRKEGER